MEALLRRVVLIASVAMVVLWLVLHGDIFLATADDRIRCAVGGVFALLIILRGKARSRATALPAWRMLSEAVFGTVLFLCGTIFGVRQFEWIGLLLMLHAALAWSLPGHWTRDLRRGLLLVYFIHPLPGQLVGPLQFALQRLSTMGSEWVLHCLNIRAWADGLVLYDGLHVFEVPEACSGMRTVSTVLLCSFGAGLILRFSRRELAGFAILGVAQALLLNVARISSLAVSAADAPADWSYDLHHGTTGLFLLAAIVLVQLEATAWKRWLAPYLRAKLERRRKGRPWRPTLPNVLFRVAGFVLCVSLAAGVAFAAYKRRPTHRAAMIAGAAELLMETDAEAAERAAAILRGLVPDEREYRLMHVRAMLRRGKYAQALDELATLPTGHGDPTPTMLKVWALASQGQLEQARALLAHLPQQHRKHPGIAMAEAELAATDGDTDAVVRHILTAARWPRLTDRVRALHPYLAGQGQWRTIFETMLWAPYDDADLLRLAAQACLRVGNTERASAVLRANTPLWTGNPAFLSLIAALAREDPAGPWAEAFSGMLERRVRDLSPVEAPGLFAACFRLHRADLAWRVYLRLRSLDPSHPLVHFAPARYAEQWFTLKADKVGLPARSPDGLVDLRPDLPVLAELPGVRDLAENIPLMEELGGDSSETARKRLMEQAIRAFAARRAKGVLSLPMQLLYAEALDALGRYEEAHALLDELRRKPSLDETAILARRASVYHHQGNAEGVYEAIRAIYIAKPRPVESLDLMLIDTLRSLDLGLYATHVARRAMASFPDSAAVRAAAARLWHAFGHSEEAFFVLSTGTPAMERTPFLVELCESTCRYSRADELRSALRMPRVAPDKGANLAHRLPRAEAAITWSAIAPPRTQPDAVSPSTPDPRQARHRSPFVAALRRQAITRQPDGSRETAADVERWLATGRDAPEKATALHALAMRLAQAGRQAGALDVVEKALAFLPESPILWRMRVALSRGAVEVVQAARTACPDDSELWLSGLVVGLRNDAPAYDHDMELHAVLEEDRFSVGTLVRAADCLFRHGQTNAAFRVACRAAQRDASYWPAASVALTCALATGDTEEALKQAARGRDTAPDPWPFRKTILRLRMEEPGKSADLVSELRVMRNRFPEETEWAERLATTYFELGRYGEAWRVFAGLGSDGLSRLNLQQLLRAAECARLNGLRPDALGLLRDAHSRFPDNAHALNNLVYTLAQDRADLPEARKLLAGLLAMGESAAVCDTAALVYHRSEDYARADRYMNKALAAVDRANPGQLREIHLNAAEAQLDRGNTNRAREILTRLLTEDPQAPRTAPRAAKLLSRIKGQRN